jgi:uncharacterized SAM-binding protein YcdF (DUF218 family)
MKIFSGEKSFPPINRKTVIIALGILLGFMGVVLGSIPVKIALTRHQHPQPQAIFVLGGDYERSKVAGDLWQKHQEMTVWLSEFERYFPEHRKNLAEKGVPLEKMRFDGNASDTVTNFTTTVDQLSDAKLSHVYLVTSDFHMKRATGVATIVYGSRGIIVTPIPTLRKGSTKSAWYAKENEGRVIRDVARSILWFFTGQTGASLNPRREALS